MISGIKQSIWDQTGIFSFQFDISVSDLTKKVNVGFTGTSHINWQLYQGKIYDNNNLYCGSYLANQNTFISGNVGASSFDYYINNTITAIEKSKPTGLINYLYINTETGNSINFNNVVQGNLPNYTFNPNIVFITGQNATGVFVNNEPLAHFRIFSGLIDNANISWVGNTSGDIPPGGSGLFYNFISGSQASGIYSGNYTFYTNFGIIKTPVSLFANSSSSIPFTEFNSAISISNISGSPGITGTSASNFGVITISGSQYINTPSLNVTFTYASGFTGNYLNTGYNISALGNLGILISGVISSQSGLFSGVGTGVASGFSPDNGISYTGLISGLISQNLFYTGIITGNIFTYSGLGIAYGYYHNASGVAIPYTGLASGFLSYNFSSIITTGNSGLYLFSGLYTGVPSGLAFSGFSGSSGLVPSGAFTGIGYQLFTGSGFIQQYITGLQTGTIHPYYNRSFTGAWNLLTGINQNNLLDFQSGLYYNISGYFNPSGPLNNFSGNSLFIRINYIPYLDFMYDTAILNITGLNSGISITLTGTRHA